MKLFEHKPFDARAVMGFGVLNGISIGLLNLSLGFNSVGFYQVISLCSFTFIVLKSNGKVKSSCLLLYMEFICKLG